MSNQDKKSYLAQYPCLGQEIERTGEELERLRALAENVTARLSGMPRSSPDGDRMANCVERIIDLNRELNCQIERYLRLRQKIADAIDTVEDPLLRLLLEYRYLNGNTWEKIAEKMSYSRMQVGRLHEKALAAMML